MHATTLRKRRLKQLLALAQAYKECTRKDLARALGRDPTKLVPGRGIPKLDVVVKLADVIEWSVGDVVAFLWNHGPQPAKIEVPQDFESLDDAGERAEHAGQYRLMAELAQKAYAQATTPEQRARACNREAGAWDGLG
ncbi:MAG: hypothetical protein ACYS0G_13735, partial [Planctomycetota bacterium]